MRIPTILFLLILIFIKPTYAQDADRKQWFDALKNARTDSDRVAGLIDIGYQVFANNKPDSAIYYYNQAFAIARRINYTKGIMQYYACYGDILSGRGQHDEAITMAFSALKFAEISKRPRNIAAAYNNIAGCYTDVSDPDKALSYYLKSIAIYEHLNDQKHLAAVYSNLLGIYSSIGHSPEKALLYGLKAVEISHAINKPVTEGDALVNLYTVYMGLGRLNDAWKALQRAKEISLKMNDQNRLVQVLKGFNELLVLEHKYGLLKANADEMTAIAQKTGDAMGAINGPYYNGIYEFEKRDYTAALTYANMALAKANKVDNLLAKSNIYNLLSDIALANGDYAGYHRNRDRADSLQNKQHANQILINSQELETRFNLTKKQAQIDNLNKEKQIKDLTLQKKTFYIIALSVLMIILIVLAWLIQVVNLRKHKLLTAEKDLRDQQIQNLEKEKQLLSTEALMKGQEAERSRLAKDLHDGLGGILTGTKYSLSSMQQNMIISAENAAAFEKTMNMLDRSISELRRVAHNMMPESLLKLELDEALQDYCAEVTQSGALPIVYQSFGLKNMPVNETVKVNVYRVIQELINNSIKHAAATEAMVQLSYKDSILGITVEDNGKGMNVANLENATGIGYQNTKSRIEFLRGTIDIQSAPGKGTSVFIKIPLLT